MRAQVRTPASLSASKPQPSVWVTGWHPKPSLQMVGVLCRPGSAAPHLAPHTPIISTAKAKPSEDCPEAHLLSQGRAKISQARFLNFLYDALGLLRSQFSAGSQRWVLSQPLNPLSSSLTLCQVQRKEHISFKQTSIQCRLYRFGCRTFVGTSCDKHSRGLSLSRLP